MPSNVKVIVDSDKFWMDNKRIERGTEIIVSESTLENMRDRLTPVGGKAKRPSPEKGAGGSGGAGEDGGQEAAPAPRSASVQDRHEILRKVAEMNDGKVTAAAANALMKGGKKFTDKEIADLGYGE